MHFGTFSISIAIDTVFPPPEEPKWNSGKKELLPDNMESLNKFQLIFDEKFDREHEEVENWLI